MNRRPLVVVSQPYVPAYRVPLFSAIRDKLQTHGIDFIVAAGDPTGTQAARGDQERPAWRVDIRSRSLKIGSRDIQWRQLPLGLRPDLVVSELEALNNIGWQNSFGRAKLVLWGHGKPYVNDSGGLADRIEWALAHRADKIMTYADGGRRYLIDEGKIAADKVVTIGNSTDSALLRNAFLSVTADRITELRQLWPLAPRALFVGGLDETKRIDFLVDAAIAAHRTDPTFSLIVVGKGEEQGALARAGDAIVHVPSARGRDLAELAHVVQSIWMPGRIGLVAVDALALGLPIFTTDYAFHAPEAEFLREDEIIVLPDEPAAFAEQARPRALDLRTEERPLRDDIPTISSVSDKFVGVIIDALQKSTREN